MENSLFWHHNTEIPISWQPNWDKESEKQKENIHYFFSTDSEKQYNENKKIQKLYSSQDITYYFNKFGYRCSEHEPWDLENTSKKRIVTLGCSNTVGLGVKWENTWAYKLSKKIENSQLFNLGIVNGNSDQVARILYHGIEILRPDYVFVFWPDHMRYERYHERTNTSQGIIWPRQVNFYAMDEKEIMAEEYFLNHFEKNRAIIKLLKKVYGFKLSELLVKNECTNWEKIISSHYSFDARDGLHPGITFHRLLTNKFIKNLF